MAWTWTSISPPKRHHRASLPAPAAAPKGYTSWADTNDGYSFVYPFGWQEVSVNGLDVVFKDVIEPLENASVSFIATEKKDVTEFGEAKEVAFTLADRVLTAPTQQVQLIDTAEVRAGPLVPLTAWHWAGER